MKTTIGLDDDDIEFYGLDYDFRRSICNDCAQIAGRAMARTWDFRVAGAMAYPGNFGGEVNSQLMYLPQ